MALLPEAVKAWKKSTDEWAAYHSLYSAANGESLVVPTLIVQVENESPDGKRVTQTDLEAVVKTISDIAGPPADAASRTPSAKAGTRRSADELRVAPPASQVIRMEAGRGRCVGSCSSLMRADDERREGSLTSGMVS